LLKNVYLLRGAYRAYTGGGVRESFRRHKTADRGFSRPRQQKTIVKLNKHPKKQLREKRKRGGGDGAGQGGEAQKNLKARGGGSTDHEAKGKKRCPRS